MLKEEMDGEDVPLLPQMQKIKKNSDYLLIHFLHSDTIRTERPAIQANG